VVNAELVKENEQDGDWGAAWLTNNDAGSGSYVLDRFDPAIGFSATRFEDHFYGWEDKVKHLDAIEFRTVQETNTRVLGLLKGDYHGSDGYLPYDQVERLLKSDNVKVLEEESMRLFVFHINNQRAPLDDVDVRRAISYAFDYDGFIQNILSGSAERNPVPIPNTLWGVPKDAAGYNYDVDKAKSLAEGKVERPIEIAFLTGFSQTEQAATVLQNGLRKAGIESNIVNHPWPVMVEKMAKPETSPDMVILWVSTYYADPNNWIGEMYNSKGWGTFKAGSFYKNEKVDQLLDTALAATDQEERAKAYEEAARIVTDEAAGVWVYNTKWYGPYANNVQGVRFCPIGNGQEMRWVYFE
jgi:peptide/nickel transport system substrate-binding protein